VLLKGEAILFPVIMDVRVLDRSQKMIVADLHLTNYRIVITSAGEDQGMGFAVRQEPEIPVKWKKN